MSKYQRTKEQCFTVLGEYNSKRNLRPKLEFAGLYDTMLAACANEIIESETYDNLPRLQKGARYSLRSVYGSKY